MSEKQFNGTINKYNFEDFKISVIDSDNVLKQAQ